MQKDLNVLYVEVSFDDREYPYITKVGKFNKEQLINYCNSNEIHYLIADCTASQNIKFDGFEDSIIGKIIYHNWSGGMLSKFRKYKEGR